MTLIVGSCNGFVVDGLVVPHSLIIDAKSKLFLFASAILFLMCFETLSIRLVSVESLSLLQHPNKLNEIKKTIKTFILTPSSICDKKAISMVNPFLSFLFTF